MPAFLSLQTKGKRRLTLLVLQEIATSLNQSLLIFQPLFSAASRPYSTYFVLSPVHPMSYNDSENHLEGYTIYFKCRDSVICQTDNSTSQHLFTRMEHNFPS